MAKFTKAELKEYFELQTQLEKLQTKYDTMKEKFKTSLPVGEWPVDDLEVKVYDRAGAVDYGKVMVRYPPEEMKEIYTLQPDNELVKQHIPAAELNKLRKDSSRIVSVKKKKGA